MRYATWKISWPAGAIEGHGPEEAISKIGCLAEGLMSLGSDAQDTILGYVHGDCFLHALDEWEVTEVSSEAALSMAQAIDPEVFMDAEGRMVFPMPSTDA